MRESGSTRKAIYFKREPLKGMIMKKTLSHALMTASAMTSAVVGAGCSSHDMGHMGGMSGDVPTSKPIAAITYDALFVVNGADGSISVIKTDTNEVAGTIALEHASFSHHVYLSPDRSKLLVAVPGMDMSMGHEGGMHGMPGAVMLLDATTGATIKAVKTPAMNHNATFSPNGAEIWTSQMDKPGSVLVLDPSTLATKKTIAVGDEPAEVTFSVDGTHAFVANGGSNTVSVIDTASKQVTKTIDVGMDPVGAWQGSNGIAYVDNEVGKTLTAIDAKALTVKLTYNLGFMPGMAALGPDGNVWVTDADDGKVILFMATMDMKMGEIKTGDGAHAIVFSGDGKTAYVTNQMASTVSVIDIATQSVTKTIAVGQKPNGLVWRAK